MACHRTSGGLQELAGGLLVWFAGEENNGKFASPSGPALRLAPQHRIAPQANVLASTTCSRRFSAGAEYSARPEVAKDVLYRSRTTMVPEGLNSKTRSTPLPNFLKSFLKSGGAASLMFQLHAPRRRELEKFCASFRRGSGSGFGQVGAGRNERPV